MKPLGIYWADQGLPAWASFACLRDFSTDEELAAALALSRTRGTRWVLYIGATAHHHAIVEWVREVKARLDRWGLLPFIAAATYHEEWYSKLKSVGLPRFGGGPQMAGAGLVAAIDEVRAWVGAQHAVLKHVFPGVLTVVVDRWWNNTVEIGPEWYHPVPPHTDLLAVEAYVPQGEPWGIREVMLRHATTLGSVVVVVPTFAGDGWPPPAVDTLTHCRRWLDHPRVVAGWCFDWANAPFTAGVITGLRDLPQRADFERIWRVRS